MPSIPKFPFREQFENLFRFDDKVAIIAGGCGGIGSVISHGLAQLGDSLQARIMTAVSYPKGLHTAAGEIARTPSTKATRVMVRSTWPRRVTRRFRRTH